jgi:hypothetical protein
MKLQLRQREGKPKSNDFGTLFMAGDHLPTLYDTQKNKHKQLLI